IPNSDFNEICETFKIPPDQRQALHANLDGITAAAERLMETRSQPHPENKRKRRDDRRHIRSAISGLEKAQQQLDSLSPEGQDALVAFEHVLGPLVSTD